MEVRAISKSVRISPRKIRLIADAIRRLSIDDALEVLQTSDKRAAGPLSKTLLSAVANAVNNAKLDRSNLEVATILVNEGQALKRFRPSTRGRIHPYKKRGSNITIILKEKIDSPALPAPVKAEPPVKEEEKEVKKDMKKEKGENK